MSSHRWKITKCCRCGLTHDSLEFHAFRHPPFPVLTEDTKVRMEYRWWASCPVTGDPILIASSSDHILRER